MRGMFTAGATDVMMEHHLEIDGAIGVSAGAAFGINYKSRQIGRVIRYNTRFCADKRYCGLRSLITTGNIYNTRFAYEIVPTQYDPFDFATYEANPMTFYVVCTDVESGRAVYHNYLGKADHGFDWIRASASMPLVSRTVEIEGQHLLDGGITDPIPLQYFEQSGYTKNVVILTQPRGYRKKRSKALPLIRLFYRRYPQLVQAMAQRHEVYNAALDYVEEQERAGNILVLRPAAPLPVQRVERNADHLRTAYEMGRETAAARIRELRDFLS